MSNQGSSSDSKPLIKSHGKGTSIQDDDAPTFWERQLQCAPTSMLFLVVLLVFICMLTFGSYFCYDNPAALTKRLINWFHISNFEYEWFYSVYSWPNTVQVFFGGWFIDRFLGLPLGGLVFCGLICLGQIIFAVGVQLKLYWLAIIGRFVFGLGGESLSVAQSTYCAKWFQGSFLSMAFGITLSFSRVGSAMNFNISPVVAQDISLPFALWLGAIFCVVSVTAATVLGIMDKRAEAKAKEKAEVKAGEKVSLRDVIYFPPSVFMLYGICVTFYVSVFVFVTIGTGFLTHKYGMSQSDAGHVLSIPYILSACASPVMGFIVDRVGRNVLFMTSAASLLVAVHVLLAFTTAPPILCMVMLGVGYSVCAASLWPSVAIIIPVHQLGTAYGLMTALQNLGLAVAPLLVGAITTPTNYAPAFVVFIVCAASAAGLGVLLIFIDIKNGVILNASAKRHKERKAELAKAAQDAELGLDTPVTPLLNPQPRDEKKIRNAYLMKLGVVAGAQQGSRF